MTENIVTGKKYRVLADAANKVWNRISIWSKASDTEFNDGKTAETKLGAINGITSDVNCEDETVAASAAMVNQLNSNLEQNKNLTEIFTLLEETNYPSSNGTLLPLLDDIKNFKKLGIRVKCIFSTSTDYFYLYKEIPVNLILKNEKFLIDDLYSTKSYYLRCAIMFTDDTTIKCYKDTESYAFRSISVYGFKTL